MLRDQAWPIGVGRRRAIQTTKIQQPTSREDPTTKLRMAGPFQRIFGSWCWILPGAWLLGVGCCVVHRSYYPGAGPTAKYRFVSKCETGADGALVPQSRYLRHLGRGSVCPADKE